MSVDIQNIIPVLLGGDLNCYSIARAIHEEYGTASFAFGRYVSAPTKFSKIINFKAVEGLDNDDVMRETLQNFSNEHEGKKFFLFACNDEYSDVFSRIKDSLPQFVFPYPKRELRPILSNKSQFYDICDKYEISHPKTVSVSSPLSADKLSENALGFSYPIVIKPSSSIAYWQHPFEGQDKVFFADDQKKAERIVSKIFASGYDDSVVLQEKISGTDSNMRVLTCFSDESAKVRAICLGHTMIEEHTPAALGNHAAILTEKVSDFPQIKNVVNMLEDIGYVGFSNFDIKLSEGTNDNFNVFEINLRQGRSNYYVTGSGLNLAKLAIEKFRDGKDDVVICENEHFWHHVPKAIVYKYTSDKKLVELAKKLDSQGKSSCTLDYKPDLKGNFLRRLCVIEQKRRQFSKFKKYYPFQVKN